MAVYNSIIPIMTSNNQNGFTVSATSFVTQPYQGLDGIYNGSSYYRSAIIPTLPEYFTVIFPKKYKVARYTLYLGYASTTISNMATWEFQGLIDNNWVTLHSGSNTQTANTLTFDIIPTNVDGIRIKCNSRYGTNSWGFDELMVYEIIYENKILIQLDDGQYVKVENDLTKYGVSKFDFEESDSMVVDSLGNYNGIANGTTLVTGYNGIGKARSFNGTSDYISFSSSIIPVGKKSIRFKIKVNNITTAWNNILNNRGANTNSGNVVYIEPSGSANAGKLSWSITQSGTQIGKIMSPFSIFDGNWHDILLTYDGNVTMKMYIDDMINPVSVVTTFSQETKSGSYNLVVGKAPDVSSDYFNGILDQIEIYNEVIEPDPYYNNTLVKFDSTPTENDYIKYGMKKDMIITLNDIYNTRKFINKTNTTLGNGKVFFKSIDTTQLPIKKLTIQ